MNTIIFISFYLTHIYSNQISEYIDLLLDDIYTDSLNDVNRCRIVNYEGKLIERIVKKLRDGNLDAKFKGCEIIKILLDDTEECVGDHLYSKRLLDTVYEVFLCEAGQFLPNLYNKEVSYYEMFKKLKIYNIMAEVIHDLSLEIFEKIITNLVAKLKACNSVSKDEYRLKLFNIKEKIVKMILNPNLRSSLIERAHKSLLLILKCFSSRVKIDTVIFLLDEAGKYYELTTSKDNYRKNSSMNLVHPIGIALKIYNLESHFERQLKKNDCKKCENKLGFKKIEKDPHYRCKLLSYSCESLYEYLLEGNPEVSFSLRLFLMTCAKPSCMELFKYKTLESFLKETFEYIKNKKEYKYESEDSMSKLIPKTIMKFHRDMLFISGEFNILILRNLESLYKSSCNIDLFVYYVNVYLDSNAYFMSRIGKIDYYKSIYTNLECILRFALFLLDDCQDNVAANVLNFYQIYCHFLREAGKTNIFFENRLLQKLAIRCSLFSNFEKFISVFKLLFNFSAEKEMSKYQTFNTYFSYKLFGPEFLALSLKHCYIFIVTIGEIIQMIENEVDLDDFLKIRRREEFSICILTCHCESLEGILNNYLVLAEKVVNFFGETKKQDFFIEIQFDIKIITEYLQGLEGKEKLKPQIAKFYKAYNCCAIKKKVSRKEYWKK